MSACCGRLFLPFIERSATSWLLCTVERRNNRQCQGKSDNLLFGVCDWILSFRIDLTMLDPTHLHFVFLQSRRIVEDSTWPRFTLLGQGVGSMYLAWEAMSNLIPGLFIGINILFATIFIHVSPPSDSMGYAFTYPSVSWLARIPVGAYVHYPTISTDMLARVRSRQAWHTNDDRICSSTVLSRMKLM